MKHFSPHIVINLVNVFEKATAFQEFSFSVKYCPFTSTLGVGSLFLISYRFGWYSEHMSN